MAKEALETIYSSNIFRETFRSESETRRNGGTPTDVDFNNGIANFDGATSFIEYTPLSSKRLGNTCSIEIWVKPTAFDIANYIFFARRSSTSTYMTLLFNSGVLRAYYANNAAGVDVGSLSKSGLALNTWHHIVFTRENTSTIKLYVNGVLEGTATNGGQEAADYPITLGGGVSSGSTPYKGDINLFQIYDKALTPSEIKNLYEDKWNKEVSGYGGQGGADLGASVDFTTWTVVGNGLATGAKSFSVTSGASVSGLRKTEIISANKRYRIKMKGTTTMTGLNVRDFNGANTYTNLSGNFDTTITISTTTDGLYFRNGADENATITFDEFVIQELQPDLLLDYTSLQGTIKDRTGKNSLTATDVSIKKIGLSYSADFNGGTSGIDLGVLDNTGAKTFYGWFKARTIGEGNAGHIYSDEDYNNIYLASNTLKISRNGSTSAISASIDLNKMYFYAITSQADGTSNIYLGDLSSSPALSGSADQSAGTPQESSTATHIGNRASDDRCFDGFLPTLSVVEGLLDTQTLTQIWSESRKNYI